jgi:hypothetical protein
MSFSASFIASLLLDRFRVGNELYRKSECELYFLNVWCTSNSSLGRVLAKLDRDRPLTERLISMNKLPIPK